MRLITSKDILGQMARFAVQQHPYHAPDGLFEVCKLIDETAEKQFDQNVPTLPMRYFEDSQAIRQWLHALLDNHPTLTAWNTPRSGHSNNVFLSRYDAPSSEDDFIDLDVLFMNVAREVWRDAEDFDKDKSCKIFEAALSSAVRGEK